MLLLDRPAFCLFLMEDYTHVDCNQVGDLYHLKSNIPLISNAVQ